MPQSSPVDHRKQSSREREEQVDGLEIAVEETDRRTRWSGGWEIPEVEG
jgi:hypothetical protein